MHAKQRHAILNEKRELKNPGIDCTANASKVHKSFASSFLWYNTRSEYRVKYIFFYGKISFPRLSVFYRIFGKLYKELLLW